MQAAPETLATHPQRWRGPSFAAAVSDGQTGICVLGGYRHELAGWEGRLPEDGRAELMWMGQPVAILGDASHAPRQGARWASFELEIILDDGDSSSTVTDLLTFCAGTEVAEGLPSLPGIGSVPISANQDLWVPDSWRALGITAVDLRVSALPTRRRKRGADVVFGSRWLRLLVLPHGFVALWYPIEGHWPAGAVRWPHHCLPSRGSSWLRAESIDPALNGNDRLLHFLRDLFVHEEYFVRSWNLELELWEERLFGQLVDEKSEIFDGLQFPDLQRELGHLADYLAAVRFNQRNFTRRADESYALSNPDVRSAVAEQAAKLGHIIDNHRTLLRQAFSLLSNAATGEQFYASRRQQRISERLQGTITFITVVLLVPTLVAGIYGTNIRELSNDGQGRFFSLVGAMALGAALSAVGLRWYQRKPLIGSGTSAAIILMFAGVLGAAGGAAWLTLRGPSAVLGVVLVSGALIMIHSLVWLLFMRPRSRHGSGT